MLPPCSPEQEKRTRLCGRSPALFGGTGHVDRRHVEAHDSAPLRSGVPSLMPRRALVTLLALGLALVVPRVPWSVAPWAQPQRAAISRSGVLGGASYLVEVPEN